jgi:hypothetical protein
VADLDRRATRVGGRAFALLAPPDRHAVVLSGLRARGVTGHLYTGAVFLTQVALYAGIYDDEAGSPLIDFPGAGRLSSVEERTWPATDESFRPGPARAGNPLWEFDDVRPYVTPHHRIGFGARRWRRLAKRPRRARGR